MNEFSERKKFQKQLINKFPEEKRNKNENYFC